MDSKLNKLWIFISAELNVNGSEIGEKLHFLWIFGSIVTLAFFGHSNENRPNQMQIWWFWAEFEFESRFGFVLRHFFFSKQLRIHRINIKWAWCMVEIFVEKLIQTHHGSYKSVEKFDNFLRNPWIILRGTHLMLTQHCWANKIRFLFYL